MRAQQGSFVLKHQNRRRKQAAFENPDFAEALYGASSDRLSSGRQGERKARQFCRQVQRALNLALADRHADDGMNDLFVEEVSPAPDCGHLLVHVVIPARPVGDGGAQRTPSRCATPPFGSRHGHHAEACAGTVVRTGFSGWR